MKSIFVLLLISSLFSTASFAQKSNTQNEKMARKAPPSLVGVWTLSSMEGEDVRKLFRNAMPYVSIDPKGLLFSGNNSCNSFSCPVKLEGNKITFLKEFTQTLKACEGNGEQKFMEALKSIKTFSFDQNRQLNLNLGDKGILKFKKIEKRKK